MITTTLYNVIRSELIKKGFNEFVDKDGNLVIFEKEHQFITKIFKYDKEVSSIVDDFFVGLSLKNNEHDTHFKRGFIYRFLNRQINRQTIEAFQMEIMAVFMSNEKFINSIYEDFEKYINQSKISTNQSKQTNSQSNDGSTTTDNRSVFADLPQTVVNIDVDNTHISHGTDNTVSRNKQRNLQESDGITESDSMSEDKAYQLDELMKSSNVMEQIYNNFDRKCFMQIW